jgi:hypothetical protein
MRAFRPMPLLAAALIGLGRGTDGIGPRRHRAALPCSRQRPTSRPKVSGALRPPKTVAPSYSVPR